MTSPTLTYTTQHLHYDNIMKYMAQHMFPACMHACTGPACRPPLLPGIAPGSYVSIMLALCIIRAPTSHSAATFSRRAARVMLCTVACFAAWWLMSMCAQLGGGLASEREPSHHDGSGAKCCWELAWSQSALLCSIPQRACQLHQPWLGECDICCIWCALNFHSLLVLEALLLLFQKFLRQAWC